MFTEIQLKRIQRKLERAKKRYRMHRAYDVAAAWNKAHPELSIKITVHQPARGWLREKKFVTATWGPACPLPSQGDAFISILGFGNCSNSVLLSEITEVGPVLRRTHRDPDPGFNSYGY